MTNERCVDWSMPIISGPSDEKTTLSYFVPKSRKWASKLTCARNCMAIWPTWERVWFLCDSMDWIALVLAQACSWYCGLSVHSLISGFGQGAAELRCFQREDICRFRCVWRTRWECSQFLFFVRGEVLLSPWNPCFDSFDFVLSNIW